MQKNLKKIIDFDRVPNFFLKIIYIWDNQYVTKLNNKIEKKINRLDLAIKI